MFCHTGGGGGTLQFLRGTALCFISAFSCQCISFSVMPFLFIEYCNAFIPTVDYSENSSFKNLFNIKQISTFFFSLSELMQLVSFLWLLEGDVSKLNGSFPSGCGR